jgi:photosystem II stability/assembly factor-like uncharacterized protein
MHPQSCRYNNNVPRVSFSCFALIACLIFVAGCGQSTDGTTGTAIPAPTKQHTPTAASGKSVLLQQIHMFNGSAGWAITYDPLNNARILHTTAGVTNWRDVTPVIGGQNSIIGKADFFDSMVAWATVSNPSNLFVYRTHNGGQTWEKFQLPDHGIGAGSIFFLNLQVGWILVGKGAAAGSEAVDVLYTGDGGMIWKIVSVTSYTNNSTTALPFGGDKSGISFVSTTTGWATGFTNADHFAWLYVTHDGGATWQHQAIPLPADAFQVSTLPPIFFNATSGLLPVIIPGPTSQTIDIEVTHDAGASWSATSPVPIAAIPGTINFVDMVHGWVAGNAHDVESNNYINSTVYSTSDGGEHWAHHIVKFGADITMLDFASPAQGWTIDELHFLYQTTDGGQTWTRVTPAVV